MSEWSKLAEQYEARDTYAEFPGTIYIGEASACAAVLKECPAPPNLQLQRNAVAVASIFYLVLQILEV